MGAAELSIAMTQRANPWPASRTVEIGPIPPTLVKREAAARRAKIWDFSTNLHCSIIGTCLSTGELRQVLRKFGLATADCSDHDLHRTAVTLAARHDEPARQLHKALDRRHKLTVSQFDKATTEDALRALWRDAVQRGDIPGAYWATLTHPQTSQAIIREAFGEVHMLSHLVGSANRADIRRLCVLEADKAVLEARLERQQQALHEAVVSRDAQIRELRQALTQRIVSEALPEDSSALRDLVGDLERRLAAETRRRTAAEDRLSSTQTDAARERSGRLKAERDGDAARRDLDAIEVSLLLAIDTGDVSGADPAIRLDGLVVLYVGGRPNQVAPMRVAAERLGAVFLHHDGGIENHPNLLPGLTSRAEVVFFPVDCISHDAASAVKTLCRQGGKRFVPLRTASVTSLLAALRAPDLADAAD
jgi:hypothetical protein